MIFNFITVLIMGISLINLKKGFMIYLMFQVIGLTETVFVSLGSVNVTIRMMMSVFYLILIYLNRKKINKQAFPFTKPFIALFISMFVTCFCGVAGFQAEFTRMISNVLYELVFIWLIWMIIDTRADLKFLTKGMTLTFFISCVYGLFEYATKTNPVVDYKSTLVDGGITLYSMTSEAAARGYRMISFMEHPIGAGMTFALFAIFVLVSIYVYKERYSKNLKLFAFTVAGLCVACVALSKMRSAILFLIIGILPVINFKKKKFYKLATIVLLLGVVMLPLLGDNINIILGIFNKDAAAKIGGSSVEQRLGQLEAIYNLMMMSPIGGLGDKFKDYVQNKYTVAALSYESIWFEQMAKHGIIGIIANIYLLYYTVIKVPLVYKSRPAFFLGLAYWVTYTLSSVPAFRMPIFYLVLFYYIKKSDVYKASLRANEYNSKIKNKLLREFKAIRVA